jgi:hypothetical protein
MLPLMLDPFYKSLWVVEMWGMEMQSTLHLSMICKKSFHF